MLVSPLALGLVMSQSLESRVDATLRQMTLEEKIEYTGGVKGFCIRAIPRLNLPEIRMADGPVGVRNYGPTTAYPAGVSLASTWNPDLAKTFGVQIGHDARARNTHIWLAPGVNLSRVPQNGRNFEYLGEDPFLAGKMAVGIIQGVQSQGVAATIKHFVANDHESDRNNDSSEVDERTLRELYLTPFEMGVIEGKVECIMSGYNLLNGIHCSQNDWLINKVLKTEWGFSGIHMSDWGGAHDALGCALGGLDLEMPAGDYMNVKNLKPLIDSGKLKESVIDDKVRRILRVIYRMGWDKRDQQVDTYPKNDPASSAAALKVAREGTVLLKNQTSFLPLSKSKVKKILVVGPNGEKPATGGGGSSYTTPFGAISIGEALKKLLPNAEVESVPFEIDLNHSLPMGPFKAEYFNNVDLGGTPAVARKDAKIAFDWKTGSPAAGVNADKFSVRWTGTFTVPQSGTYLLVTKSDDGMRVFVDGKRALNDWNEHGVTTVTESIRLQAGRTYAIRVEFYDNAGDGVANFGIVPLETVLTQRIPVEKLKNADLVVASVGLRNNLEGEGFDRPFDLPMSQQLLLDHVTQGSNKVVLALNSGAGMNIAKWLPKVPAMVQCWYPGENGNQALAEILFGDVNPSGKLPTSFPRALKDTYYATAYPSKNRKIVYNEGLFMGYRWFDKNKQKPLYPFGFGLSYTDFKLSAVSATRKSVTAKVTNIGKRAGDEIVQVYVGEQNPTVPRPVRELKGFQRVSLAPGETKIVTISLNERAFQFWDTASHRWKANPGAYRIWVGDSSQNLQDPVTVTLK